MKPLWKRILVLVEVYAASVAAFWGIAEAYTYFTGDSLRMTLNTYWSLVFYALPLVVALLAAVAYKPKYNRDQSELFNLKGRESIQAWGNSMQHNGLWDWHLLGHAMDHYMDAIRCDPTHQHPYTNLAYVYHLIGERQKAQEYLDKSFNLATPGPNFPGQNYKRVKAARDTNSYLSGETVDRPAMPAWFREKYQRFLEGGLR